MATITITPGNSFTATEAVTSTKLNDLGSPTAALTAASIGTADIADDAITPALIAGDAVTTPAILDANVTFAKLTDVIDDDTMATATDTTLATSESIKAYIDKLKPNIVQAVKTNTFEEVNPQNVWIDVPNLSVSLTPKFSDSKIFVQAMVSSSTNSGAYGVLFKLVRDTTDIALGEASGSRTRCSFTGGYPGGSAAASNGVDYLDSPSLTAGTPVVYKLQCTCETTIDIYINRSFTNTDANQMPRPVSTLTVTEIYQ